MSELFPVAVLGLLFGLVISLAILHITHSKTVAFLIKYNLHKPAFTKSTK